MQPTVNVKRQVGFIGCGSIKKKGGSMKKKIVDIVIGANYG